MRSVLFYPYDKTQPLTKQYPELARAKQFKELKSHEQLFVWLFACQSSYLMKGELKTDNKARAKAAFEEAKSLFVAKQDEIDMANQAPTSAATIAQLELERDVLKSKFKGIKFVDK